MDSLRLPQLLLCVLSTLAACKAPVESVNWTNKLPETWGVKGSDSTDASKPWSVFYKDSVLVKLLEKAVQNSYDNNISGERMNVSYASYAIAQSNFLPTVNAAVTARVDRFGDYTMNGVGNHDTNRSETLPSDQTLPNPYPEYFTGVTFSWEANLWKKLSSRRQAAQARYLASGEAKHAVISWIVGEVASQYYELLGLDQEKKVLVENLKLQELAVELVKIQKAGGKVNQLAVDQFESQYLNTKSRLFRIEQNILETTTRINELSGEFPKMLVRDSIAGYDSTFDVHFGHPEQLMVYRPDIRQAELVVEASHADVISARAAFYPSFQLSGTAGFSAFNLSKMFISPASAIYSLGSGLSAPIIQRKRIKALYSAASARQRVALLNYQKSILQGYHEVYRILNDAYTLSRQLEVKKQEVTVLRRATVNSKDLFNVGFATYLEVITAQQRLLEMQMELAELNKRILQNRARFYRALGGGWAAL